MDKWLQKWQQLEARDKRILALGSIFLVLLLFYVYAWSPLSEAVNNEYEGLQRGKTLIAWLQHAQRKLSAYQSLGYQMPRMTHLESMKVVQQVFKNEHIDYHVETIKQLNKEQVGIVINQVPFDRLIDALTQLADQYGIVMLSNRITRAKTDGLVAAKMILTRVQAH